MADSRRRFLRLCGVCGIGALAGCADSSPETPTATGATPTDGPPPEAVAEWARSYGTSDGNDALFAAADGVGGGHFFAGGSTAETGGEDYDEWVLKLDSEGNREWEQVLTDDEGTNLLTSALSVGDGYVVGGFSANEDGSSDARVRKFGTEGTAQWDRTYAGSQGWTVVPGVDDGSLVAGTALGSNPDAWMQAVDADGTDRWSATVDGGGGEVLFGGETVADGYVFAGYSATGDGDRGYLVKVDTDGAEQWSATVTGDEMAKLEDVVPVDGGYVAAGVTWSGAGDDGTDADDGLLVKVDDSGARQWSTTVDNDRGDLLEAVTPGADGSLYAVGRTGFDATGTTQPDGLVVEFDGGGSELGSRTYGDGDYDRLSDVSVADGGAVLLAGETVADGADSTDGWAIKVVDPVDGVPEE